MPDDRGRVIEASRETPAIDFLRTWIASNPSIFRNVYAQTTPEALANRINDEARWFGNAEHPMLPATGPVMPSDVAAARYGQKGDIALPSSKGSIAALRKKTR